MNDLNLNKLLRTVAEIAYCAGHKGYYSGDSQADRLEFIWWAKEFERRHLYTDWDKADYILTVDAYVEEMLCVAEDRG